jgi:hypothetical protein|tara:strand:+ start:144 stop:326 length:183 start_codon:yes stop_codon:yes gene_type:complete
MTTISTYYCSICEAVKSIATSTLYNIWALGESAGKARAASELTRMGMHKEARALMLGDEK